MPSVAAVVSWTGQSYRENLLDALQSCEMVRDVAVIVPSDASAPPGNHTVIRASGTRSASAVIDAVRWFETTRATHLLWVFSPTTDLKSDGLRRLQTCAVDTNAAIVFSDFCDEQTDGTVVLHPLIDYQAGSVRDDFDFGQVVLLSRSALAGISDEIKKDGAAADFGGWYDLRLRLTERGPCVHLPEPTYLRRSQDEALDSESTGHFGYVDPQNRDYQVEMENIATAHLKRIGALIDPTRNRIVETDDKFSVEASVVIPVKNRKRTVSGAVKSALSQETDFEFNVIVVDNHSDDGTTDILAEVANCDSRLIHLTPSRTDLGIGGCWNEAVFSSACGRYALQLDSDDLYANTDVVLRIVAEFRSTGCAMVIGSYTIVDFDLNPIPPGLVDHREWTDENGHNNALRIAGLGAPRAFHVPSLRTIGFPNVSYGEDYVVGLRLTRGHRIGRIYESLYWCRRWEDNTDHALSIETKNRYDLYKDRVRTIEIAARQARSK